MPAVVYTWIAGEVSARRACYSFCMRLNFEQSYRENVRMISQRLSHHDFEVSLAIRLPSTTAGGEDIEDEEIDSFLGSLGFEFIDVQDLAKSTVNHDYGGKYMRFGNTEKPFLNFYFRSFAGYRCLKHDHVAVHGTKPL